MSKKLYAAFVPLLAVAAFMVVPAMAQAETTAYGTCKPEVTETANCPAGEGFVAFANGVAINVVSELAPGAKFVLKTASGATIECTTFEDAGTVENVAGVGHSNLHLEFDHCKIVGGPLNGCSVQTTGAALDTIEGNVTDVVKTETTVEVTVVNGFELKTDGSPEPCPANEPLGTVTGKATGTEAVGSNDLVFTEASGLELGTEAATITGSDETVTEVGEEPVLIN